MSYFLAFAGFATLVILHELGHFMAAKAVGMRVERFALFFPPLLFRVRRGETEYAIGAIPLGGYVRISGMSPREDLPEEVRDRAYHAQPPWKRIFVISAGPAMNVFVAFVILFGLYSTQGKFVSSTIVAKEGLVAPAKGVLLPEDKIVAIDGKPSDYDGIRAGIAAHRCAGTLKNGCVASTPARVTVLRNGQRVTLLIRPRYDGAAKRMRLGIQFRADHHDVGLGEAATASISGMWRVTTGTVSAIARIVDPKKRKEISGAVGSFEYTQQSFAFDWVQALNVLAIISLSLAIVNLFPFLPLDGGHIFWALVEKVRGRPVPFAVMERAGVVGFMLVLLLFAVGLSNDIDRLRGDGFGVR